MSENQATMKGRIRENPGKSRVAGTSSMYGQCLIPDMDNTTEPVGELNPANPLLDGDSTQTAQQGFSGDMGNPDHGGLPIPESMHRGEGDDPRVLEPTNPLMIKFQNSLRDLLLRQSLKLQDEITSLINDLKIREHEREELGERLYNLQEDISLIYSQMESCNSVISDIAKNRSKIEREIKCTKEARKIKSQKLENCKQLENKLRADLLAVSNLLKELKACEDDMESELAVSQCISEKTEKQKKEMCETKRKQDWLLMKLRRTVMNLARERDELIDRAETKNADKEELTSSLADASTDLQILQAEQSRLTQSWNRIVLSIQQRDGVFNNVSADLAKAKESFQLMLAEIDRTQKISKEEMLTNEKLVGILNKMEKDYNDLSSSNRRNQTKLQDLENQFITKTKILSATEQDLLCSLCEGKDLQTRIAVIQKDIESANQKKTDLETKILSALQDQGRQDRAFLNLKQKLIAFKDSNKKQELVFVVAENQISKYMVSIEELRGRLEDSRKEMERLEGEEERMCREMSEMDAKLARRNNDVLRKGQAVLLLKHKIEALTDASGVVESGCPEEAKLKKVEAEMEDVIKNIKEKQAFWLRLQANIVRLTSERHEQLNQLDLQYKQSQILKQRSLKLEGEIDKITDEERGTRREIENVYAYLKRTASSFFTKKEDYQHMSSNTTFLMKETEDQLKEAELRNLEFQEELDDLKQSNIQLYLEANEKKREGLNWEKKIQIAFEAKNQTKESKQPGSDLMSMKTDIHRMKIRLSHLRKIQEALMKDLDQCVSRRETISYGAEAREKRSSASLNVTSSRTVFERKISSYCSKTREAQQEMKSIQNNMECQLPEKENTLGNQVREACARLKEVENCVSEVERQIEEGQILKQQNLEEIVRRQKKAKMYSKVKEGKHCLQFRTDSRLQQEYCRQRNINYNLQEVVDLLMQDFPQYLPHWRRICCTLHITP